MSDEAGWVYDPTPKHYCITPKDRDLKDHFEGAIWRCGTCGFHWEVYFDAQERRKDMRPISPMDAEARMNASVAA